MSISTILLVDLALCAGFATGCQGGDRVRFLLEWEDVDPSIKLYPPTLALAETRRLSTLLPDSQMLSTLESASLSSVLGNRLQCKIPNLGPGLFMPPLFATRVPEYRLTIYTPGYAAVTIYPAGSANVVHGNRESSFSVPALLRTDGYVQGTHFDAMDTMLELRQDVDGGELFVVRLRKLPLRKALPRRQSSATFSPVGTLYDDVYTFYSQLASLVEAVSAGQLDKVSDEARRILADAVHTEYRSFVPAVTDSQVMTAKMRPHLDCVQSWATSSREELPRHRASPSATRPADGKRDESDY